MKLLAALTALTALLVSDCSFAAPKNSTRVVLDFEELDQAQELQGAGDLLISKGYLLRYTPAPNEPYPVGFTTVGPSWRYNGRSAAFLANSCGGMTHMTAIDNNPFDLEAIDLASLNGDRPVSVRFVGTTTDGRQVTHSAELRTDQVWQRIRFHGNFNRVISVTWAQGDCIMNKPHMYDNIEIRKKR